MSNDQDRQDEVTRLIREGRKADDLQEGVGLAVDKLTRAVPLGVGAPNKTARKVIGGAASLLHVLRSALGAVLALLLAAGFFWVAFTAHFDLKMFSFGAIALVIAALLFRAAWRAWGTLKAIARA
jgi:hypothetical protein